MSKNNCRNRKSKLFRKPNAWLNAWKMKHNNSEEYLLKTRLLFLFSLFLYLILHKITSSIVVGVPRYESSSIVKNYMPWIPSLSGEYGALLILATLVLTYRLGAPSHGKWKVTVMLRSTYDT